MSVVSVKIPKKIKEKMKEYNKIINIGLKKLEG